MEVASNSPSTPVSLLERLRSGGRQEDWERFVDLYSPLLCSWARRFSHTEDDIRDLVQEVFAHLLRRLPQFVYDPNLRFRSWIRTVFFNQARDWLKKADLLDGAERPDMEKLVAPDQFEQRIDEDYARDVVARAAQLLRPEYSDNCWRAFWETAVNERSGIEVAAELGMTPEAVYQAKSRIMRRLRQELEGLLD